MVGLLFLALAIVPAPRSLEPGEGRLSVKGAAVAECRDASLPSEGYRLAVSTNGVSIVAADEAGAFYARQTLSQLESDGGYPCCRIEDAPAYRWRGLMIDEARHFLGKDTVKRVIELMALHKLNVLHWHLTDDQGWRIDLPRFPGLVASGSVRPASVRMGGWCKWQDGEPVYETDGERYGPFYYTPDDIREILACAKAHHVTVVPEIEFPGHVRALLAAYPQYGCRGAALKREPRIFWSIEKDVLCVGNAEAVAFAEAVLDEVCRLFPDSPYVHIGGDECPRERWKSCPKCQALMKREGLKDESELQVWLTTRLVRHLERRGRRAVGWDEILAGDVPRSTVGMSWRPNASHGAKTAFVAPAEAVARGNDVVLTPVDFCYLSLPQGIAQDPFLYYSPNGRLTLERAYCFDPCAGIPDSGRRHVLGGQASVWGEFVWNRYDLEWKTWPRACAIAEALWTAPARRDFADFERRMKVHRPRLIARHVNCAPLQ